MLHMIVLVLVGLAFVAVGGKFLLSFWGPPPQSGDSSRSDWASLTGGGFHPDHHGGSEHSDLP